MIQYYKQNLTKYIVEIYIKIYCRVHERTYVVLRCQKIKWSSNSVNRKKSPLINSPDNQLLCKKYFNCHILVIRT